MVVWNNNVHSRVFCNFKKEVFKVYCSKCGAESPDDAQFCSKCGTPLVPSNIENSKASTSNDVSSEKNSNDKKNWFGRRNKLTQIIIIFFALSFVYDCISSPFDHSSQNTDLIYTQSTAEMVLTIEDMPSKWHDSGTNPVLHGQNSSSSFINIRGLLPTTLECKVSKYNSIEESKSAYQKIYEDFKSEHSYADFKSVDIGQASFSAEYGGGLLEKTVFRKGNIVVDVWSSLGTDTIGYAKKIYKRIDPKKGHLETFSSDRSTQNEVTENVYRLKLGDSIDIGDGYKLSLKEIDNSGTKVWVEMLKQDQLITDRVIDIDSNPVWDVNGQRIELINVNQNANSIEFVLH